MKTKSKTKAVMRAADARLPTSVGEFRIVGYESLNTNHELVALVKGKPKRNHATLVSIHAQCFTGDVFGSLKCDCGTRLRAAIETIEREGAGVVLYQQPTAHQTNVNYQIEVHDPMSTSADLRLRYQQCAEILDDLGVSRVRLLSADPHERQILEQIGLKVAAAPATVSPERSWQCQQGMTPVDVMAMG